VQGQLAYSTLPDSSAVIYRSGDGWMSVTIPSPLSQRRGKLAIILLIGCIATPNVLMFVFRNSAFSPGLISLPLISLAFVGGLCTALWMGFTWIVITVNQESLTIKRTGIFERSERSWPRSMIGDVRKTATTVRIYDQSGRRLARFDAFIRSEDIWIANTLRRALALDE